MARIKILCMLILVGANAVAQSGVSLQKVMDSALAHSPALKGSELGMEKARYQNAPVPWLGNTNVQYNYGQIDGPTIDYQWQFTQTLGNPLRIAKGLKLRNAQVQESELEYKLSRGALEMQVRQNYAQWQHGWKMYQLREKVSAYYRKALQAAKEKLQRGEISTVEKAYVQTRQVKSLKAKNSAYRLAMQGRQQLEALSNLNLSGKIPQADSINLGLQMFQSQDSTNIHRRLQSARIQTATLRAENQKANLWPSLRVGYLNQQLDKVAGYDVVMVGAQIPLFSGSAHQQRQAAEVQARQTALEQENYQRQRRGSIRALEDRHNQLIADLREIQQGISEPDKNLDKLLLLYQKGEISVEQFSQNLESITEGLVSKEELLMQLKMIEASLQYLNLHENE